MPIDQSRLDEVTKKLTQELLDRGRLIEVGWVLFEHMVVPKSASETQRREMRMAFFAGAQHLFSSINAGLEEDAEPTAADLRRMSNIHKELQGFAADFKRRYEH